MKNLGKVVVVEKTDVGRDLRDLHRGGADQLLGHGDALAADVVSDGGIEVRVEQLIQLRAGDGKVRAQVLDGQVPQCDCNDSNGKDYEPKQTYKMMDDSEDKKNDAFLATDCIGTEKLVSGEYNGEIFAFGESAVRKLLADIQIEEQNHAEMLYKYKVANGMV